MKLGQRLAWNVILLVAGRGTGLALSAVTLAALTRGLGPEAFGRYTFTLVFLSFFSSIADQGLNTTIARLLTKRPESAPAVIGNALMLKTVIGTAAALTAVAAIRLPVFTADLRLLVTVASGLAVVTSLQVIHVIFQVRLRMGAVVVGDLATRASFLLLAWILMTRGAGVGAVLLSQVAATTVGLAIVLVVAWRVAAPVFRIDAAIWREMIVPALPLTAAFVLGLVYFRFDTLILSVVHGDRAVGLYAVAFRVVDLCLLVPGLLMVVVFPVLVNRYEMDPEKLEPGFRRLLDLLALIGIPLAVFLTFESASVARLVGGAEFVEAAPSLTLLAWSMAAIFLSNAMGYLLIAAGRERANLAIPLIGASLNVALNLALVPRFGLLGAAWSAVVTQVVVLVLAAALTRRLVAVQPWPTAWRELALTTASVAGVLLVARAVEADVLVAMPAALVGYLLSLVSTRRMRQELSGLVPISLRVMHR